MKRYIILGVALIVASMSLGLITLSWDGASLDRYKRATVRTLAVYTTSDTTASFTNSGHVGMRVTYTATDTTLTPSIVVTVQGYNQAAAQWYTVLASAAQTGEGTVNLLVFPGAATTTNVSANMAVPYMWRIVVAHGDTDPVTYGIQVETFPLK